MFQKNWKEIYQMLFHVDLQVQVEMEVARLCYVIHWFEWLSRLGVDGEVLNNTKMCIDNYLHDLLRCLCCRIK